MKTPKAEYEQRLTRYSELIMRLEKSVNTFSRLRLLSFGAGVGLALYLYLNQLTVWGHAVLAITVIIFLTLVNRHEQLKKQLKLQQALKEVNLRSLKRLNGEWHSFAETGSEFIDDAHPYTGDLDIFGQGSLYQWISTAKTYLGRRRLKQMLTEPLTDPQLIRERQQVISELAQKLDWRQHFEGYGELQAKISHNPEDLIILGKQQLPLYQTTWLKALAVLLPVSSLGLLAAAFSGVLSFLYPVTLLSLQFFIIMFYRGQERSLVLANVAKFKDDLKAYERLLYLFETTEFESPFLIQLKQTLKPSTVLAKSTSVANSVSAYRQIEQLERLTDWIANRSNPYYLIFNILFLCDFHFMFALERWKKQSGSLLANWFNAVAELEALSSLAVIRFDHPEWTFPVITDGNSQPYYVAKRIGHPLIEDRVTNDLNLTPPQQVLLITGSNMSGKSTFLRTAGINLVLAYAGAPVCAESMQCSLLKVHTCMRVSDNLEKSISSFYAEILRIKSIVEAAARERNVFFLLDEIFKGTNSADRHTGAQILIKRLMAEGAIGLVSTHDLELGIMEQKHRPKVKNYHFREYYVNDELKFDYQLRPGISTTRNAMYLIKMAGISLS